MDLEEIKSIDSQNMWELLNTFPEQWKEAVESTKNIDLTIDKERISNICFVGMGGSAIGADLIRSFCYDRCPFPIQVVRHYEIPCWVDENTLFIACSFSGNTEETLTALTSAREKGAQIIAVTAGGELMVKAAKEEFDYIKIPGGMPPRAALGYSFVPLYRIFQQLELVEERDGALKDTARFLSEQNDLLSDPGDNEALNLAEEINDTLPIVYSDATMMEPVNLRWRNQFAENAKTLAYGNTLPEMNHNEIVGWEQIVHLTGRLSVILLIDKEDNPRVQRRMEIVEELVEDQTASLHILKTRGQTRLARMFSLIQLADWTSLYLAVVSNVDPTPIAKIDLLKSKLA
ncbi:bifunctional phosphoglucose/phosphomannose isomerase [Aliifodinibius salipaludis]|uniref:Bifunctional phosphoglucose/phosphomannose isomerase n=1 Tax=Fodinibius salipaludis TaxID=2032627 RepID=A0A2A2G6X5_9BACT|nr:bifunctional phosphoglucose/phosphomannose isomerase [Aliifodinibius salipaludis]PAU93048.1 bifunctional phosphoglucose/phosphomannose isomerase [Aliifodinibius salipaludis]